MASTIIEPVADALNTTLAGLGLKGYRWAPREFDDVPASVVDIPTVERTGIGDQEFEMGREDWSLEFPVSLYVDLAEPIQAQRQVIELFEAFVSAIDNDPTLKLGGSTPLVDEARVIRGEPEIDADRARPLFVMRCTVDVLKLVPA